MRERLHCSLLTVFHIWNTFRIYLPALIALHLIDVPMLNKHNASHFKIIKHESFPAGEMKRT